MKTDYQITNQNYNKNSNYTSVMSSYKTEEQIPKELLSSKFKILIPELTYKKISYLCTLVPDLEWSGVLFYKVDGSITDIDNLSITVLDVYPLDVGSSTFTDYEYNDDYISYRVSHPELLEEGVFIGHVHSHNHMAAFFSGTDVGELISSAPLHNVFVSLIVNNAGEAVVGLSYAVTSKLSIETKAIKTSLDFNGEEFTFPEEIKNEEKEVKIVYYAYGEVSIESSEDEMLVSLASVINRIKAAKTVKTAKTTAASTTTIPNYYNNFGRYKVTDTRSSNKQYNIYGSIYDNDDDYPLNDTLFLPFENTASSENFYKSTAKNDTNNVKKNSFTESVEWLKACIVTLGLNTKKVDTKKFFKDLTIDVDTYEAYETYLIDIVSFALEHIYSKVDEEIIIAGLKKCKADLEVEIEDLTLKNIISTTLEQFINDYQE